MPYFTNHMWLKKNIQLLSEEMSGYRMYFCSPANHGHHDFSDIKRSGQPIRVIFDVGANIGQSTLKFIAAFPRAKIYSFEPGSRAFASLSANLKGSQAQCHRLAFGRTPGSATLYIPRNPLESSLVQPDEFSKQETVEVATIDRFAADHRVDHLDLLKIDTEGYDLEVLKGASELLSWGHIAFVLLEVGFDPRDKRHVLFDDARDFLIEKDFSLFGFYDQTPEGRGGKRLRYANALFYRQPKLAPSTEETGAAVVPAWGGASA